MHNRNRLGLASFAVILASSYSTLSYATAVSPTQDTAAQLSTQSNAAQLSTQSNAAQLSTQSNAVQCDFNVTNEWNSGFTSSITLSNDGNEEINGWVVGFEYPDGSRISNAWNTNLAGSNPYELSNKNYNGRIRPGQSVSFGFNSRKANNNQPAAIPTLSGICDASVENGPEAIISASAQSGEIPLTIEFDGTATSSPNGDIAAYSWNFDDGNNGSGATVSHTFQQAGNYEVALSVTDASGASHSATFAVSATAPQPSDALCEFSIQNEWNSGFTGQVRITNDAPYNIEGWTVLMTFPDATKLSGSWNSKSSGSNPYTLSNANYNANIQPGQSVQFGFNAQKAQQGAPASVPALGGLCRGGVQPPSNQPPVASASASVVSGVAPLRVDFSSAGSGDPDGDNISYLWTFSNGSESTEEDLQYTFTEAGNYTVTLLVSDGELDVESETIAISVEPPEVVEAQSWQLDPAKSSLWFVSSKKLHILENHTFTTLTGDISADGDASLTISLDTVESAIDVRNQRMREHLFETSLFPEAQVMLSVDTDELILMAAGTSAVSEISALLNLHGVSVPIQSRVRISKLPDGALLVNNLQPILLAAADFNLDTGIDTLKQLAGLSSISYTVPVNFHLLFTPIATTQTTDLNTMGEAK